MEWFHLKMDHGCTSIDGEAFVNDKTIKKAESYPIESGHILMLGEDVEIKVTKSWTDPCDSETGNNVFLILANSNIRNPIQQWGAHPLDGAFPPTPMVLA